MLKRVVIVDSGLKHLGGHNFSYTKAVKLALEERGLSVTVFANKGLMENVAGASGYYPVFSLGSYDWPPGNGKVRDLMYIYAQSIVFSDELEHAFKRIVGDDCVLVLSHTVKDFELIGWSRYVSRGRLSGHLMLLERESPDFSSCGRLKLVAHPYWRIRPHYLKAIRAKLGVNFVLLTDSELLSEEYAHIYRHRIVTLPIPVSPMILNAEETRSSGFRERYGIRRDEGICVGFVGDDRAARGLSLLPELVARVATDGSAGVRFVIQCPNSGEGSDDAGQTCLVDLKRLARERVGRVTLICERLVEHDYVELLRSLDVVLLPYTQASYGKGTSGVFAEALAMAKPVVVSSGTWMARELRRSGGGAEFRNGDIDDLASKVLEVARHYKEYALKARQFSSSWRELHNPRTLVEVLLRESGLEVESTMRSRS